MRINIAFIFFMLIPLLSLNVRSEDHVGKAQSAYSAQQYTRAIEEYEQALKAGDVSSEMYFNLGNAYYYNDDYGHAVVSFLKSLKYDSSNSEARNNLNFIQSKVEDMNRAELKGKTGNVSADEPDFFTSIYENMVIDVHPDTWAVIAIVSFILLLCGVVLYVFVDNVLFKKMGFFGGIVCLVITIVANILMFCGKSEYHSADRAVVTEFTIQLKADSKESAPVVSTPLHSGTILDLLDERTDVNDEKWIKLRLNSETAGWVKMNEVEIV